MFSYSNSYIDYRIFRDIYNVSYRYEIVCIDEFYIYSYYKNNKLHREGDEPARIFSSGYKEWCKNGEVFKTVNEHGTINFYCFD